MKLEGLRLKTRNRLFESQYFHRETGIYSQSFFGIYDTDIFSLSTLNSFVSRFTKELEIKVPDSPIHIHEEGKPIYTRDQLVYILTEGSGYLDNYGHNLVFIDIETKEEIRNMSVKELIAVFSK